MAMLRETGMSLEVSPDLHLREQVVAMTVD